MPVDVLPDLQCFRVQHCMFRYIHISIYTLYIYIYVRKPGGGGSLALFGGFDGFLSGAVGFVVISRVLRVPSPYCEGA